MTPEDFDRWVAYSHVEPFGMRALARMMAHLWRSQLAKPDRVEIDELMAAMGYEPPPQRHFRSAAEETEFAMRATFGEPM